MPKSKVSKQRRIQKRLLSSVPSPVPPKLDLTVFSSHTFRFLSTSPQVDSIVATTDLFNMLLVATSTTTTDRLISGLRIKHIRLWAGPTFTTGNQSPSELVLNWTQPNTGSDIGYKPSLMNVNSMSNAIPGYLELLPVKGASNSTWQSVFPSPATTGSTLGASFVLTCPSGSILDIAVTIAIPNGTQAVRPSGITSTSLTLGQIYSFLISTVVPQGLLSA